MISFQDACKHVSFHLPALSGNAFVIGHHSHVLMFDTWPTIRACQWNVAYNHQRCPEIRFVVCLHVDLVKHYGLY